MGALTRRRRETCGAALLEACIVLSVLVSFFGITRFTYERARTQLTAQHSARRDALFYASHDCEHAPTEPLYDFEPRAPRQAHVLASREGSGADTKLRGELNSAIATSDRTATVGHLSTRFKSTSWVVCNERAIDGGPVGFFEFGYRFFDSYFSKRAR